MVILNNSFEYSSKVVIKSTKLVIYKEATLLVPGIYADSATKRFTHYPQKIIKRDSKNWKLNYLSIDHSKDVLKRIGKVKNAKWKNGKLVGDLHIYTVTSAGKDVVNLIENGLINWMSVEVDTEDKYNYDLDMMETKSMEFVGASVVSVPACKGAKIVQSGPGPGEAYYN
jgi:hypothetical protein